MAQRGTTLRVATTLALALAVGCSSAPKSAPRREAADDARPGIALPAPNAVLLGAVEGDEAYRNDQRLGSLTPGGFTVESVEREWYERDRVLFGRSYVDSRVTTRVRQRSFR